MAVGSPPRADEGRLMELLRIFEDRHRHTHETIWEVEKHFTWWVYIIFGAIGAIALTDALDAQQKEIVILFLGLAGVLMSVIGYMVLKWESNYFDELRDIWKRIYYLLNLPPGFGIASGSKSGINLTYVLPPHYFLEVPQIVPKGTPRGFGVRRAFQTVMIGAGVLFVVVIGIMLGALVL